MHINLSELIRGMKFYKIKKYLKKEKSKLESEFGFVVEARKTNGLYLQQIYYMFIKENISNKYADKWVDNNPGIVEQYSYILDGFPNNPSLEGEFKNVEICAEYLFERFKNDEWKKIKMLKALFIDFSIDYLEKVFAYDNELFTSFCQKDILNIFINSLGLSDYCIDLNENFFGQINSNEIFARIHNLLLIIIRFKREYESIKEVA